MAVHTVTLREEEFKLFQAIQTIAQNQQAKRRIVHELMQQLETIRADTSPQKNDPWLQIGDSAHFRTIEPVKPEQGAPLVSDTILEQRKRF